LPADAKLDRLRVVLVASRNPLNIGAAARAMGNFGFSNLRVVNPYDVAFREARSAVGASAILAKAEEYKSVVEAVGDCTLVVGTTAGRRRQLRHLLRPLAPGARIIRKRLGSSSVALLFGSEKRGLSAHDLSHCHWLMHIPTCEGHLSMNLGQAVALCLYELVRAAKWPSADNLTFANAGEIERITKALLEALRLSGYEKPNAAAATELKIRGLVRRLCLQSADADVWLGILRQFLWKMKS